MDFVIQKVYDTIAKYGMIKKGDRVLVGLSGGADSVFLTLALLELKSILDFEIYAVHLNHGIRGDEAQRDENFVKDLCRNKNIPLFSEHKDIPSIAKEKKISEETAGRNERYKLFISLCSIHNFSKIAVAHNANDNVETVLLNLIRGSALKGLCGIKPVNNNIIRPIIDIKRCEIEEYLSFNNQPYCTDSTNLCDIYTRNKIRNNIIKSMEEINPSLIDTVTSNLEVLNNDEEFISSYASNLRCITKSDEDIIINRNIFDKENISVKKRILLTALESIKGNCNNISSSHLSILSQGTISGKSYDMPDGIKALYASDKIIFTKKNDNGIKYFHDLKLCGETEFCKGIRIVSSYCGKADFSDKTAVYLNADVIKNPKLTVRSRNDGDSFIPYGMTHQKKLKQFMIDMKIPLNEKNKIPIVLDGDEIAAVLPYRISDKYKINSETKNILKIQMIKESK